MVSGKSGLRCPHVQRPARLGFTSGVELAPLLDTGADPAMVHWRTNKHVITTRVQVYKIIVFDIIYVNNICYYFTLPQLMVFGLVGPSGRVAR